MGRINEEEFKKITSRLEDLIGEYSDDPVKMSIIRNMLDTRVRKANAEKYSDRERHLTWVIANTAYEIILDDNISAKDSLVLAAQQHEADIEQVLAEKSSRGGNLAGSIVKSNDQHPVQRDMKKKGKFNRQAIKNSKNVWQMLNLLKDFRQAYSDLLKLESALERIDKLEADTYVMKEDIQRLKNLVGMKDFTDKDKAKMMLDEGFSKTLIAETLGKSIRTIHRWV